MLLYIVTNMDSNMLTINYHNSSINFSILFHNIHLYYLYHYC